MSGIKNRFTCSSEKLLVLGTNTVKFVQTLSKESLADSKNPGCGEI